jgi:polyisoprenoid-binding protein YceI
MASVYGKIASVFGFKVVRQRSKVVGQRSKVVDQRSRVGHRRSKRVGWIKCFAVFPLSGLAWGTGAAAYIELPEWRSKAPVEAAGDTGPGECWAIEPKTLSSPASVRYRIDGGHSRFMVKAFASGLLSFAAHNHNIAIRDFSGDAEVTYGTVEPASLNMRVRADSLAVTDKVSDSDRQKIETTMRNDVLETARYPDIVFQSTGASATRLEEGKYQAKITGNLTLHGTTHTVTVNARLDFGTDEFHAVGEFPIRQSQFGIKPVSVAGGTIKVKDEVKLSFDIVGRRV